MTAIFDGPTLGPRDSFEFQVEEGLFTYRKLLHFAGQPLGNIRGPDANVIAGCTVSDALLAVLAGHYTDGGYTRTEKHPPYNQQVEASRNSAASLP